MPAFAAHTPVVGIYRERSSVTVRIADIVACSTIEIVLVCLDAVVVARLATRQLSVFFAATANIDAAVDARLGGIFTNVVTCPAVVWVKLRGLAAVVDDTVAIQGDGPLIAPQCTSPLDAFEELVGCRRRTCRT